MAAERHEKTGWRHGTFQAVVALVLAAIILAPRLTGELTYPLHDVGFNLEVLADLDRTGGPVEYLECAAKHRPQRFYPAYWAGQHLLWRLGGRSLDLFMPANLLLLTLLFLGVARVAAALGGSPLLAVGVLLVSPGLVENTHTIMKQELPLAVAQIWLLVAVTPLLRSGAETRNARGTTWRVAGAALLLLLSGTLKETGAIAGIALALWLAWNRLTGGRGPGPGRSLALAGLAALSLGLGGLAFAAQKTGAYTKAVSLSPAGIVGVVEAYARALWPWLLYLPGTLWLGLAAWRGRRAPGPTGLAVLLLLGWASAYTLWATTQIRYFLPAMTFLAALVAVAWARRPRLLTPGGWGGLLLVAGLAVSAGVYALPRGVEEYRARLTADTALARTRAWLADRDQNSRILVCLTEDEPLQELRGQLAWAMGRPDLVLEPALAGKTPAEWAAGLAGLAADPPRGTALLIPFAANTPDYADRIFPVTDEISPWLEKGVPHVLGDRIVQEGTLQAGRGAFVAGFRVYRFRP